MPGPRRSVHLRGGCVPSQSVYTEPYAKPDLPVNELLLPSHTFKHSYLWGCAPSPAEEAPHLRTTYYLLLTTHYLLLTTYYLLLTTYYLLLTTYYSLLTTYYLLLTTYYAEEAPHLPYSQPHEGALAVSLLAVLWVLIWIVLLKGSPSVLFLREGHNLATRLEGT